MTGLHIVRANPPQGPDDYLPDTKLNAPMNNRKVAHRKQISC